MILAIDPGPVESAYTLIDSDTFEPARFAKLPNEELRRMLREGSLLADEVAIEMIASYGMAVGAEVFDTCVWIGRFAECSPGEPQLVFRREVKLHHCMSAAAKDPNIIQALIDRFAKGEPNKGKGTKGAPGWFYGFAGDVWQAYALAVHVADVRKEERG